MKCLACGWFQRDAEMETATVFDPETDEMVEVPECPNCGHVGPQTLSRREELLLGLPE